MKRRDIFLNTMNQEIAIHTNKINYKINNNINSYLEQIDNIMINIQYFDEKNVFNNYCKIYQIFNIFYIRL